VRISCAEGITKWRSRTMASQRRTGGGAHLSEGEENGEGEKYLQPSPPFIGKERERERVGAGPPSQHRMPPSSRTGERVAYARFSYLGLLTGGPVVSI
jgi:hypothetical protein